MDEARAARMSGELMGTSVGGWKIVEYLGAGKSALVFLAEQDNATAALKIFDPELVQRFGTDVQTTRIQRELSLRGKNHPHLVKILDGGQCPTSELFFIVMERLDGKCLADAITSISREQIWPLIAQIASAAKYLEELNLVHRDIKPDNIFISDDHRHACLMDFGVIRPVGEPGITDGDQRPFIGTLQYSSPEFLFRTEDDTPDGWRALTFYQLGAVLHDLIMKERIFIKEVSPFAALVEAVKSKVPRVEAHDIREELLLLARSCLSKDPTLRLRLVRWADFEPTPTTEDVASGTEERIRKRQLLARGSAIDSSVADRAAQAIRRTIDHLEERIQALVRKECVGNDLFPPAQMLEWKGGEPTEAFFLLRFEASVDHALDSCFQVWFSVRLIDPASMVIQITSAASLSISAVEPSAYALNRAQLLFEGTMDETIIASRLKGFVYTALDQAQSTSLEETTGPDVKWLPCTQETR